MYVLIKKKRGGGGELPCVLWIFTDAIVSNVTQGKGRLGSHHQLCL